FFAEEDVRQRFGELLVQLFLPLLVIFLNHLRLLFRFSRRELYAGDFLAAGNLDIHDDAIGARGHGQRRVFHVRRLLAEDGAQEALLRGEFGFGLRRDLADENVARLHFRADTDDTIRAEIAQRFFRDVRDVAGDFLGAELGVAGADLKFIDVDRGVDVF